MNYLYKLMTRKVWLPTMHRKTHETSTPILTLVIIFDYDDTLFCTSHVAPNGIESTEKQLDAKVERTLDKISRLVVRLLDDCQKLGKVYIITNAIHGWVEYSIKKYLPVAAGILEKVQVISARAEFEDAFPDQVDQWKMHAFLAAKTNPEILTNIIAVGDANRDLVAAHHLAGYMLD
eukprot:TRINITY_DN4430_c0_g2_i11.p1 TRINITY_DN4430_c0_g2~~TRINITY_DN4430_c0_g2_i11.p1  ORF type:complete len:177 (-),score=62.52 TRINITY_DN4430_c0_g2_i11:333-863(-)